MSELEKALAEAREQLRLAQEEEEHTEEAMDSMERRYWEGYTEALEWLMAREGK
jgi:outer membrane protein TolC